jgi:hypothetical protein
MKTESHQPLVPIVLAVTGHRDLRDADLPVLAAAVTEHLRQLSNKHPHSPCVLLSGLAEGADRLAARCALDAGWKLGVVLPLPQQAYEQDFAEPGSVEEFRDLLSRAAWCRDISAPDMGRPGCYDALGEWLAQHSHALLALWDGEPGRGPGGTAEVVRRFREGATEDQDHLVMPDSCPVIHVRTPRATAPQPSSPGQVGAVQYLSARPGGHAGGIDLERWNAALERIEQFNCDVHQADQKGVLVDLVHSPALPLPPNAEELVAGDVQIASRSLFLVADKMAVQAQRERSLMFKALLLMAAGALVLAQTYSSLFTLPAILWSAIGLSCLGIAWYRISQRRHVEQRYLDYRALAEACKIQYFWQVAGVRDSVCAHYLRQQSDELEWIRLVLRSTTTSDAGRLLSTPQPSRLRWVRDNWLEDQRRYFLGAGMGRAGKAAQNRRLDEVWSRRSQVLAVVGAGLMLLTAGFHLLIADLTLPSHDWLLRGLMVGYSVVFGAAGLCKVYQQTSAFAEHAKKYERTGFTLQVALGQVDAALEAGDESRAVGVIRSFGIEALDENGDWLLLHRDRPVSAQGFG